MLDELSDGTRGLNDKEKSRFHSYSDSIQGALRAFDKAKGWADLLGYTQKLLKVVAKGNTEYTVVPEKQLMTRRLGQCLNPNLPAGLHQNALEVMECVLSRMDVPHRAANIEFTLGMFPLFRTAAIAVRGRIIEIIDKLLLPLEKSLLPILDALVLSLLPGIEEVSNEFYSRTMKLLEDICKAVGTKDFYRSIWTCIMSASYSRLAALHFLKLHLPSLTSSVPHDNLTSSDISSSSSKDEESLKDSKESGPAKSPKETLEPYLPEKSMLVLHALVESLQDEKQLVQRETLELLTTHFRFEYEIFSEPQLHTLVKAALLLLNRKELSLTRRLFSWLLNAEGLRSTSESESLRASQYFEKYARDSVILAISELFDDSLEAGAQYIIENDQAAANTKGIQGDDNKGREKCLDFFMRHCEGVSASDGEPRDTSSILVPKELDSAFVLRPINVLEQLVEREEIGGQIIDDVLGDVVATLASYRPDGPVRCKQEMEILAQVQDFLDMLENGSLWSYLVLFATHTLAMFVGAEANFRSAGQEGDKDSENDSIDDIDDDKGSSTCEKSDSGRKQLIVTVTGGNTQDIIDGECISKTPSGALGITDNIQMLSAVLDTLIPPQIPEDIADLVSVHYPRMLQVIVASLRLVLENKAQKDLRRVLQLTLKVMGKIPVNNEGKSGQSQGKLSLDASEQDSVESHVNLDAGNLDESGIQDKHDESDDESKAQLSEGDLETKGSFSAVEPNPEIMKVIVEEMTKFFVDFYTVCELESKDVSSEIIANYDLVTEILSNLLLRCRLGKFDSDSTPEWVSVLCKTCESQNSSVAVLAIRCWISLAEIPFVSGAFATCSSSGLNGIGYSIAMRLWDMFDVSISSVHYPAVVCMLQLERVIPTAVQTVFTTHIAEGTIPERVEGLQRFSLLWKLAGECKAEGLAHPFTTGLFDILGSLHNEHPDIRICGRSWLGDNAERAERILDPLLLEILDPSTVQREGCVYNHPYDTRRVLSILRMLRTLFGPENVLFASRASQKLVSRDVIGSNEQHAAATMEITKLRVATYADLVTVTCLRYIQGTFPAGTDPELIAANAVVQSTAAELLDSLLVRVVASTASAGFHLSMSIQDAVLSNMAQAINNRNLVLQVKLLLLLRTIVQVNAIVSSSGNASIGDSKGPAVPSEQEDEQDTETKPLMELPMFTQTLIVGLIQPSNKTLRCHWLDFLLCCIALNACKKEAREVIISNVIEALAGVIKRVDSNSVLDSEQATEIMNIVETIAKISTIEITQSYSSALNINSLSTNMGLGFGYSLDNALSASSDTSGLPPKGSSRTSSTNSLPSHGAISPQELIASASEGSGLVSMARKEESKIEKKQKDANDTNEAFLNSGLSFGINGMNGWGMFSTNIVDLVQGMFGTEDTTDVVEVAQNVPGSVLVPKFRLLLSVFMHAYGAPVEVSEYERDSVASSMRLHNAFILQDQIIKALDILVKYFPTELLDAFLSLWPKDRDDSSLRKRRMIIEIINTLEGTSEESIFQSLHVISSAISMEHKRQPSRSPGTNNTPHETELILLDFMGEFISNSNSVDSLCSAWPSFSGIIRMYVSTVWCPSIATTVLELTMSYFRKSKADDEKRRKKLTAGDKKERQELAQRIYDSCVSFIQHENSVLGGFATEADYRSSLDDSGLTVETDPELRAFRTISTLLLPILDFCQEDVERLVPMVSNLSRLFVPFTRIRWSPHAEYAVKFFASSCEFGYAVRAWRKEVWDVFHENEFFYVTGSSRVASYAQLAFWAVPINQLMTQDKLAWSDLLKNVMKALQTPATVFARENDGIARSKHLRRMSFAIFCGSSDQYVKSVPAIKERLSEAFKVPDSPLLQCQVFLCIRVLFLRIPVAVLSSFLPVIFSELLDVFLALPPIASRPKNASEAYAGEVLLEACKLVDTMLLLSDCSSLLYQWLFIDSESDTVPPAHTFKSFFSRLAAYLGPKHPYVDFSGRKPLVLSEEELEAMHAEEGDYAKPIIRARSLMEQDAFSQLQKLLNAYSVRVHNRQVHSMKPDIAAISELILTDFTNQPSLMHFTPRKDDDKEQPQPQQQSSGRSLVSMLESASGIPTALH